MASATCWTMNTIDRERNADCDYIQYATELFGIPTMMKYWLFYERPADIFKHNDTTFNMQNIPCKNVTIYMDTQHYHLVIIHPYFSLICRKPNCSKSCKSHRHYLGHCNISQIRRQYWSYLEMAGHHDDVIKWKHFQRYWPFVRGIHRSPVTSPHKGQWRRSLMFSLICSWIDGWVNNGEAGDLRRHRANYDGIVMISNRSQCCMKIVDLFENLLRIILLKYKVSISIRSRSLFQYPTRHLMS